MKFLKVIVLSFSCFILGMFVSSVVSASDKTINDNGKSIVASQTTKCSLNKYYPVKGTPYKVAVEKYKDGLIRFKAKQIQKTYLYLAVPLTHELTVKIKDRYYGIGGWVEVSNTVYETTSFYDKMVKTACAIARAAGCSMTADEVGADVMEFEFGD